MDKKTLIKQADAIFDKHLTEVDNWNSAIFYTDKQAFLNELIEAITVTRCSTQLKSKNVISFEEWKKRFVVKTETNNIYEFRGDFVLGEDLEFAYNKDVEIYNSLIV